MQSASFRIESNTPKEQKNNEIQAAAEDEIIESSIDVKSNETLTINIDGVLYSVKNNADFTQSFSYTKNKTTGELTVKASNFLVVGVSDVEYNIIVQGSNNTITTGDRDDIVRFTSNSKSCTVNTNGGNDKVYSDAYNIHAYLGEGDDYFEGMSNSNLNHIYGDAGNDTLVAAGRGLQMYGGDGNDKFILSGDGHSSTSYFFGEQGDDVFDLTNISSSSSCVIIGGEGTNTLIGQKPQNVIAADVVGGTDVSINLAANESKQILINGIKYTLTNLSNNDNPLIYSVDKDGVISFWGVSLLIEGEKDKAHNVVLQGSSLTFYGGNLDDKITVNANNSAVYAGDGNDEIILNSYGRNVFGEGGDDHIIINAVQTSGAAVISGGDGNDIFDINAAVYNLHGDEGNDVFNLSAKIVSGSVIDCGSGDNTVNVLNDNISNVNLIGSGGVNTLNGTLVSSLVSGFGDYESNAQDVQLEKGETKEITINGKKYKITNNYNGTNAVQYYYNPLTDEITFSGSRLIIEGQDNTSHNVILKTIGSTFYGGSLDDTIKLEKAFNTVYAGSGDDTVTVNENNSTVLTGDGNDKIIVEKGGSSTFSGGNGDDEIILNGYYAYSTIGLGEGNDTYEINSNTGTNATITDLEGDNTYKINADNTTIASGGGNDTFIINSSNNTILGQGGDDYFEINGNSNTIDGGTGTNFIVEKTGTGNIISNVQNNPNAGFLIFNAKDEVQEFQIDGKKYIITNNANSTPTNQNRLYYNYNQNTGELTFTGDNFTIQSSDNTSHNLVIEGSNNIVSGGNKNDKITVNKGSNNIIKGGDGNDTLTTNSENNSLLGETGSDTININASTNQEINGGSGNDIINVNSNNNTNIQAGSGNDNIKITGSNNTVNGNDGNNTIIATGNNNTLSAENGNNRISAIGNSNTITSGSGYNTLGVDGENNSITSNGQDTINIYGNLNTTTAQYGKEININGNQNTVKVQEGENTIKIKGSENIYNGGKETDNITIIGDKNIATGGEGNDYFMIKNGNLNNIDGNAGTLNTMVNYGTETIYKNVIDITPDPTYIRLQVGPNGEKSSSIEIQIDFKWTGLELDYSSESRSAENIELIDNLQKEISRNMSKIGALINRLESAVNLQTTQIENLSSSVSTIMDADIAQESAEYVKNQILTQTAAALLSVSARHRSNLLLSLING